MFRTAFIHKVRRTAAARSRTWLMIGSLLLALLCCLAVSASARLQAFSALQRSLTRVGLPHRSAPPRHAAASTPNPATANLAAATTIELKQTVNAGGGEESANGGTRVHGTLGQGLTGQSSGGAFSLSSGFWPGGIVVGCQQITLAPATLSLAQLGKPYNQPISAAPAGGNYSYSLSHGALPPGMQLVSGVLSGTPTGGGTFNFSITAADSGGCTGKRDYRLIINRPPALAALGNKQIAAGQTLSFSATATDPDASDLLGYALSGAPAGALINPGTGQFSWTPTQAQTGTHTFNVVVTDNGNPALSDSKPVTVTVVSLPPALTLMVSYLNTNPANVGLSVQLKDSVSGVPLPGKIVSFTIGNQTVTGTTDGHGVALGQISVAAPGAYTAKASFAGDAFYPLALTVTSFKLTLGGQSCAFTHTPASQSFAANGGTSTVQLTTPSSNCNWSAASTVPWITLSGGLSGTSNGTVSYTVASNPTTSPRSGAINVAGLTFTVLQGARFLDVPPTHPLYTEIGKLSARGVTLGCGGGNYCPDTIVTREQMAAFIIRSLGEFNPPTPTTQRFADVLPANPLYAFIEQMAVRGITAGCGSGNYCPTQNVTREQLAAFLIRALHEPGYVPPVPALQRFLDVLPGNPFYAFVDELAARGITLGCGGGNYCPTQTVTRGQMAVFLVRAFGL
jgi:hypothetical protein